MELQLASAPALPPRGELRERARRALEAVAGRDEVLVLHLPAPVVDPAAWLARAPEGAAVLWDPPTGTTLAGRGAAYELRAEGDLRFTAIAARADRLWPRVREHHESALAAPRAALIGGFSFAPGSGPAALGDAWFVLPEWRYARDDRQAFLSLGVRGDLCSTAAARARRLAALDRELDALSALASSPARDPGHGAGSPEQGDAPHEAWSRGVAAALAAIERGEATKVVLARILDVPAPVAPASLACARLARLAPESARFALRAGETTFLGATPERLIARRGRQVRAEALAGTARATAAADGARLLASDKDLREHAVVVRAIQAALAPACAELRIAEAPSLRALREVQHLVTPICGTLGSPVHLLELAEKLHPTPAVCGEPRELARRLIAAHEPDPRGWYAGLVGAFDATGDGELWVALRSALLHGGGARLYAGAGLVAGSDAHAEWDETRLKLRRMLEALGAGP